MKGEDDKFYYIPIDPYSPEDLTFIDVMSPLLVNPTPRQFEKGAVYTYIVASIIQKDPYTNRDMKKAPTKLYACKAQNMFEFGTKHHQIFYRMGLTDELDNVSREKGIDVNQLQYALFASGEIKCIDPFTLVFNFFSGTYKMAKHIPPSKEPAEIEFIRTLMEKIDPRYVIRDGLGRPFIVPETMSITHEQIRSLNAKGIPTFEFDTQKQCYDMKIHVLRVKNMEKRTVGFEEMNQKYQEIMNPPPAPPPTDAYIMGTDALKAYAATVNAAAAAAAKAAGECDVPIPIPIPDPYDKTEFRRRVQAHMDANKGANMGNGGGKQRTMKQKMMCKKKTLKKQK